MSESMESAVEEAAVEVALPLPGAVLRAAREAQGYSLAEIAQVLKFGMRQLEALENDDYSTLKGATFIRGFVRSYARYLKLDEAPLLAALEPQAPLAVVDVRPVESMGAEMPVSGADGSKRAYGFAVGVLLLGAVAWFVWQEQAAPVSESSSSVEVLAPATVVSEVQPAEADMPTSAKPAEPASATSPDAPEVLQPNPAVPSAASNAESGATATATAAATVPAQAAAPASPNDRQLLFVFSGVSWVEVRDVNNRILYSGNSTPDSRETVRGRPPFQLVIGNAQSVKLRYEDRAIDLQPYTRVDVARLTLDDNTK
jgi:cytoskeleton protein RodZ